MPAVTAKGLIHCAAALRAEKAVKAFDSFGKQPSIRGQPSESYELKL